MIVYRTLSSMLTFENLYQFLVRDDDARGSARSAGSFDSGVCVCLDESCVIFENEMYGTTFSHV